MTTLRLALLSICLAVTAQAQTLLPWAFEASRPVSKTWEVYHGETVTLAPTLLVSGDAATYPTNATATLYYQTNGMASAWWSTPALVTTNAVRATWSGSLDIGASAYSFFIKITDPDGAINYRATGSLTMMDSPGFVPNTLPLPELLTLIDFNVITPTNAPWTTPAAVSNIVEAAGGGSGSIDIEEDPVALPVASNALTIAQAAVPKTRKINGQSLLMDLILRAEDLYAMPYFDGVGEAESGIRVGTDMGFFAPGISWLTPNGLELGAGNASYPEKLRVDYDGISMDGYFWLQWPTNNVSSPIATLADINNALEGVTVEEADPLSIHTAGGTMTGPFKLAESGITWQGVNIATNFTIRAEYDGTNVNFNVYMEAK